MDVENKGQSEVETFRMATTKLRKWLQYIQGTTLKHFIQNSAVLGTFTILCREPSNSRSLVEEQRLSKIHTLIGARRNLMHTHIYCQLKAENIS